MREFVLARHVVPSVPPGRMVNVPEASEHAPVLTRRNGVSGLGLFIEYNDAAGITTVRRIACKSYDVGHDAINAWCFERQAPRQFRLDRIATAACPETGELFELGDLLAVLRQRQVPLSDRALVQALTILTFLMHCDGATAGERDEIEQAVTGYALRFDGDDALVDAGLRYANSAAPDGTDFLRGMRSLAVRREGPALARFVRDRAARVIDADAKHTAEEIRFGCELGAALTRIISRGD